MAGFMKLEVWYEPNEVVFSTNDGGGEIGGPGWYARYSAPGYLDCTDSVGPFKTAEEAAEECFGLFSNDTFGYEVDKSPDYLELCAVRDEIRAARERDQRINDAEILEGYQAGKDCKGFF